MNSIDKIANYNYKSWHILIFVLVGLALVGLNAILDKKLGSKSNGHVIIVCVVYVMASIHFVIGKYIRPIAQKLREIEGRG